MEISNRQATTTIYILSTVILGFLFWLIYFAPQVDVGDRSFAFLPLTNAVLNTISATLVITGLFLIKTGNRQGHIVCMASATVASALFLIGYIIYHSVSGDTKFQGEGIVRPIYFALLASHVLLSMAVVPMILGTLFFSITRRYDMHKRWARITYPVWIYVSVTGVLVYLFLRVWFPGVEA